MIMIIDFIESTKHLNKKYIIFTDSLGKEDILIKIAEKF